MDVASSYAFDYDSELISDFIVHQPLYKNLEHFFITDAPTPKKEEMAELYFDFLCKVQYENEIMLLRDESSLCFDILYFLNKCMNKKIYSNYSKTSEIIKKFTDFISLQLSIDNATKFEGKTFWDYFFFIFESMKGLPKDDRKKIINEFINWVENSSAVKANDKIYTNASNLSARLKKTLQN